MAKKVFAAIASIIFTLSLASLTDGYDNNPNRENGDWIPYTKDNIDSGKIKGGHDTLTVEGMLLKKKVHKDNTDFQNWADRQALPSLRIGAHDEDSTKSLDFLIHDPPIGSTGWGGFFSHFYNYSKDKKGFKGWGKPAPQKAKDYIKTIKNIAGCTPGGITNADANKKKMAYEYFGKSLHLLQDMGVPSHTKDDAHPFKKPFEKYVNDHWDQIVNSPAFIENITGEQYLNGNYEFSDILQYWDSLAEISSTYPSEEELYDLFHDPITGVDYYVVNEERLMNNINKLVPATIMHTAGYIDSIYDYITSDTGGEEAKCALTNYFLGKDHPDDRFDVSDEFYWEKEFGISEADLTDLFMRTAMKKGKMGVWYWKQFTKIYAEAVTKYADATKEEQEKITAEYKAIEQKLEERRNFAETDWKGAPDVALFAYGFHDPSISLLLKFKEPVAFIGLDFDPSIVRDHPVMVVPSGGLYGLENSNMLKAKFDEYVRNGGILIVFTQQHGYEFSILPVPQEADGTFKQITGYGWTEDQSCFNNAVYIDTYHQILSGQNKSTPSLNVDGYFTDYPASTTILLRRTSNGQPAMIMYDYGVGKVIVAGIYSDWAYGHSQASKEEIDLVRDMICWAKNASTLPEIRLYETVSVSVDVMNHTTMNASSVKLLIYDPDRRNVLSSQTIATSILAGQPLTIPVSYSSAFPPVFGIYHIDYELYDENGIVIQPQAETDSGRFAVSKRPGNPYKSPDFNFSIQSDTELYLYGSPVTFTVIAWNNTDVNHTITFRYYLPNLGPAGTYSIEVPAGSSASFTIVAPEVKNFGWLKGGFFDETGKQVGYAGKGIWMIYPSVNVPVQTDKAIYVKGDTVIINTNLQNNISLSWQSHIKTTVIDPENTKVFEDVRTVNFSPSGTVTLSTSFILLSTSKIGTYTIKVESYSGTEMISSGSTGFQLPQSQISVISNLPSAFTTGINTIPFLITNTGRINVSSGVLDVSLKDPDGANVYSESYPFDIAIGQSKIMDVPISIPASKFGNYILTYTQSDETRAGQPVSISIASSSIMNISSDKAIYKIGETANIAISINNTGKFRQDGIITIDAPFLGFTDTKVVTVNPEEVVTVPYNLLIPVTLNAGGTISATFITSSGDQVVKALPISIAQIGANQNIIFDKLFYKIRDILGINYTVTNNANFASPLDVSFSLSIPDLNYAYNSYLMLEAGKIIEIPFSIPIPETFLAGQHQVLTSITFPSGDVYQRSFNFTVPESNLIANGPEATTFKVGDTLSLSTENIGGVDTTYTTEKLTITDDRGVTIYQGTGTGTIMAGEKKSFVDIVIPSQTINGTAFLNVQIKDSRTGELTYLSNSLEITGLTASLQTRTNKEAYFVTEGITVLTTLTNDAFNLENGEMAIKVTKSETTKSGTINYRFSTLLPKGWWPIEYPYGVAIDRYDSLYVADTYNSRIMKFDNNGHIITTWGSYGGGDGEFDYPIGITVGPDSSIYVADTSNHRIQKFDSNGNFIITWGSPGQGNGQFWYPANVSVGPDGSVYVAELWSYRIQKFDRDGNFINSWDNQGSGDGEFNEPTGVAVSSDNFVYVADSYNCRIQKFDSSGNFITKWGDCGTEDGQFLYPTGIVVDPDGSVYVADHTLNNIQKFDKDGNFITRWGSQGSGDGQFQLDYPVGIMADKDGSVLVADTGNNRIQKFDSNGNFLTKWVKNGSGDGQFEYDMCGIEVDNSRIYVADPINNRVQVFDLNGNFISKFNLSSSIGLPRSIASDNSRIYVTDRYYSHVEILDFNGQFLSKFGNYGSGEGKFNYPEGIAADSSRIYVVDSENHRVQLFDLNGNFISKFGSYGSGDGQFSYPTEIAIDSNRIYVADQLNHRVQIFDLGGNFIAKFGEYGIGDGQFDYPLGISVDSSRIYVSDSFNHRVQIFDLGGNFIAKFGEYGIGAGQFDIPYGVAIGSDGSVFVVDSWNYRVQKMEPSSLREAIFETTIPVTESANTTQDYTTDIGISNVTGKLYLQAELKNSLGQRVAKSEYPFYIIEGNTALLFSPDKKSYKTGETITIVGEVKNLSSITASALGLQLSTNSQNIYTATFDVPADGRYPFTVTTSANSEGTYSLTGKVTQNNFALVEISDHYEVASPKVSVSVTVPEVVDNEVFDINVGMKNEGKVTAFISLLSSVDSQIQQITIPADETKLIKYTQHIANDTTYTFTFTGDLEQTIQKTVLFGEKAELQLNIHPIYEEGNITIFYTITNTGKLEADYPVTFTLFRNGQVVSITTATFMLPVGGSGTDILNCNLNEGLYTLRYETTGFQAESQINAVKPGQGEIALSVNETYPEGTVNIPYTIKNTGLFDMEFQVRFDVGSFSITEAAFIPAGGTYTDSVQYSLTGGDYTINAHITSYPSVPISKNLKVLKENNIAMDVAMGSQASELIPIEVTLANFGFNEINGSVGISLGPQTGSGQILWSDAQFVAQLLSQNSQLLTFNINPSVVEPGNYILQTEFLNNSGQQLGVHSLPFTVRGPMFHITQLPPYQTFTAGEEATFTFKIRNMGNREGAFDFRFRAYDLIDSTQREWLTPNEERPITFSFMLPSDLEEKDFYADYELKSSGVQVAEGSRGQVKYHLAGININVSAILDKQYYSEADTVHLALVVNQASGTGSINLFARVNYNGYEEIQPFLLNEAETLNFNIPLTEITGEKLFYGIYHESGRSIHLNSLYIYKKGDVLTITTDKQVYNPGETVSITVHNESGTTSSTLTLSALNYSETFVFTGVALKSFTLPDMTTSGTYHISYEILLPNGETYTGKHPFDVAGVSVKVKEAILDKGKYATADTLNMSLTIESNQNLSGILKTWIVDPEEKYTNVGESSVNLFSAEPLFFTGNYSLSTSISGIHRLVYGIYTEGLLLASGSEAFDVGNAVLINLTTDKTDYSTNTEVVHAKVNMYGTVDINLELQLDENTINAQMVSLNGFSTMNINVGIVEPGNHLLKATITAGGLKNSRETTFTYALSLLDSDRDGMPDEWETSNGLLPKNQLDANLDPDNDGLTNLQEYQKGTDPHNQDTDNDGMPDGWEVNYGLNPDANDASADKDNDGFSNYQEYLRGSNPADPASVPNQPPFAHAGPDQNVVTGKLVTLNGSDSYDPESALIAFHWALIGVPVGSNVTDISLSDPISAKPTFTPDVDGTYRLELIVNDGALESAPDEIVIIASIPNVAPNANAGPDQNVSTGATVYLDGSRSNDPDNDPQPLSYLWSFDSVPGGSFLTDDLLANRDNVSASFIPDADGSYIISLNVSDGDLSSRDTVQVIATTPNVPPNALAGSDIVIWLGQTANLDGSASNDPDNGPQPLSYKWSFVSVPPGSQIDNEDISDRNSVFSTFIPDISGTYVLELAVSDGLAFDFDNAAVTVIKKSVYCTILGNDPKPSILDQDIFKFYGIKGEKVIIRLESNPSEAGSGKRAALLLASKIPGVLFVKIDQSSLPNDIAATLPATGEYFITVAELPKIARGERYRGAYCLSLEASQEIMQTLKPALWVE